MAKRSVCAVYDSAIQSYGQPFFVPHRGSAMRSFTDEVNRKADDNSLNKHPADFELFELAAFDDETGKFEATGERLLRGVDVLKENE